MSIPYNWRRNAKWALRQLQRSCPLVGSYYIVDHVFPEQAVARSTAIQNLRVLFPEERVCIASPEKDPFVPVGKYYREGCFDRPNIFVCEVPEANLHVGLGMVCTRDLRLVADLDEARLPFFLPFGKRKPATAKRLHGTYACINHWNADNFGHWMFDCLPRLHSIREADPKTKVTVLMPDSLRAAHRESLDCILPSNCEVEYHPYESWLQLDNFMWASLVSGRCNFFLPAEYFEAIRRPVFSRFGLPTRHHKTERIFVTRRQAGSRRVLNEEAVSAMLARYGFVSMELRDLSFRQQVELFHRADIVIGVHGAGLSSIVFSGDIHLVVLYPTRTPQNHWHTLAKGLGQEHHFVLHDGGEEDDFSVNTDRLKQVLENELGLLPRV